MRQRGSVNVIVYVPKAETCQAELSRRIASVHADAVIGQLQKLLCPTAQKLQLLDTIITQSKHLQKREKGDKLL